MAWIEQRQRVTGGRSVRIKWRLGGGRRAPFQIETFSAGSDAQNQARAEGFKTMVEAAGNYWPDGWVKGEGFVRVHAEVPYCAPPSFAAVGEGAAKEDPKAPSPKAAIAGADIVTITLGANDAPWQRDEDPVCNGEWQTKTCKDTVVKPSVEALGKVIDAIDALRKGKPTAIRVTNFYNELIESADLAYIPNRPQKWIDKGSTSAKAFSYVLNADICATANSHGARCIDIYHAINGPKGTKALPANWFVWPGHRRGYDQTFTADAIMRAGFAPLTLG